MEFGSDTQKNEYIEITVRLLRTIWTHSEEAADCVEQIYANYGPRAAYLAAFALTRLKQNRSERRYPPTKTDLQRFTFFDEMHDKPEAVRLYEAAAVLLLPDIEDIDRPPANLTH